MFRPSGSIVLPFWINCVGPRSGREGEKCRPLDHMRQIPFIHQLCSHYTITSISVYIYNTVPCISFMWYLHCVLEGYICYLRMRSFKIASVSRFRAILKSFCLLYAVRIGTRFSETMPLKLDTDASLYGILGVGQIPDNIFCGASWKHVL